LTQIPCHHNLGVFGLLSHIHISALWPLKNDNCKVIKVEQFARHPSGTHHGFAKSDLPSFPAPIDRRLFKGELSV
jgi:hypothetical protein